MLTWDLTFFCPRRGCIDFNTVNTTQHLKSNFQYAPFPQDYTRPRVCNTLPRVSIFQYTRRYTGDYDTPKSSSNIGLSSTLWPKWPSTNARKVLSPLFYLRCLVLGGNGLLKLLTQCPVVAKHYTGSPPDFRSNLLRVGHGNLTSRTCEVPESKKHNQRVTHL